MDVSLYALLKCSFYAAFGGHLVFMLFNRFIPSPPINNPEWTYTKAVSKKISLKEFRVGKGKYGYIVSVLGGVERIIYVACMSVWFWQGVAGWFVVKSAIHWPGWGREKEEPDIEASRARFNRFLIGAGLSLIIGVSCGLWARDLSYLSIFPAKWPRF